MTNNSLQTNNRIHFTLTEIQASLDQHKGQDISMINVKKNCQFTDWMIFCTGTSKRHTQSLSNYLCEEQKKKGNAAQSSEGQEVGEWIIVDFVDVVVHIMQSDIRALYALEKLWQNDD